MSLGNFATYANAGGELRFGLRLPDDFGTAPLRPAGENTAPVKVAAGRRRLRSMATRRYSNKGRKVALILHRCSNKP